MDKIKQWITDPKNRIIAIAGGAVVVVILAFILVKALGGGSEKKEPAPSSMAGMPGTGTNSGVPANAGFGPGAMKGGMGMKGMGMKGMGMKGMGMKGMGMKGMGMKGMANATGTQAMTPGAAGVAGMSGDTTVVAAAPVTKIPPMLPYRKDPFQSLSGTPTRSRVLQAYLPSVVPVRLPLVRVRIAGNSTGAAQLAPVVLPPQPIRRMAGVMMNGKISAVLETNGESDIVVPGMEITRGNSRVRVESITPDEIILKTMDTARPFTIKVNIAGSVTSAQPAPQNAQRGIGGPAMGMRGLGRRPGSAITPIGQ